MAGLQLSSDWGCIQFELQLVTTQRAQICSLLEHLLQFLMVTFWIQFPIKMMPGVHPSNHPVAILVSRSKTPVMDAFVTAFYLDAVIGANGPLLGDSPLRWQSLGGGVGFSCNRIHRVSTACYNDVPRGTFCDAPPIFGKHKSNYAKRDSARPSWRS